VFLAGGDCVRREGCVADGDGDGDGDDVFSVEEQQ
jgi:hypothetical protein